MQRAAEKWQNSFDTEQFIQKYKNSGGITQPAGDDPI